jgi:hypothetical protein
MLGASEDILFAVFTECTTVPEKTLSEGFYPGQLAIPALKLAGK